MKRYLETALHNQAVARQLIVDSGIIDLWESRGAVINHVGSYVTNLLVKHRDLDFHIYTDHPCIEDGLAVIGELARRCKVVRMTYGDLLNTEEECLEFHVWVLDAHGDDWQFDMIHIRRGSRYDGHFERFTARLQEVLTPEQRDIICTLKYDTPEGVAIAGIIYYYTALACGIRDYDSLARWRTENPNPNLLDWCP